MGQALVALAVAQEAVVADFDEAFGEQVESEAAEELFQGEGHGFAVVVVGVILVSEGDGVVWVVEVLETAFGEGDAMGVAGEVGQDLSGAGEGAFGIDIPGVAGGLTDEGLEDGLAGQGLELAVELELVGRPS